MDIFPNKYILKSQLFVIKNLVILAKASTLDHSTKIVLQNKQIINVIIIDIVIFLLDIPIKKEGTIQNRLLRIDNAKNEAKVRIDDTGQTAVTHYSVLQNYMSGSQNFSLIECRIETGRTHQIRVHLSHIGHPIL